jgi:hypothetical protein
LPKSETRLPAVSVVIAAFADERWDQLCEPIESVRSQTAPALETVVVIDHNPALLARARRECALTKAWLVLRQVRAARRESTTAR